MLSSPPPFDHHSAHMRIRVAAADSRACSLKKEREKPTALQQKQESPFRLAKSVSGSVKKKNKRPLLSKFVENQSILRYLTLIFDYVDGIFVCTCAHSPTDISNCGRVRAPDSTITFSTHSELGDTLRLSSRLLGEYTSQNVTRLHARK